MTFAELHTLVRERIIVDEYEDAITNAQVDNALWLASTEIAAAFDFPQVVATLSDISAGATAITAPADCRRVESLAIDGDDARPVDMQQILRMRMAGNQPARYFNYDPRRGGDIQIAPPSLGGTPTIVYTQSLTRPAAGATFDSAEPWGGILASFHTIIAYRAGIYLFEQEERENEIDHLKGEYRVRADELALFLGRSSIPNRLVEPPTRNDEGAEG